MKFLFKPKTYLEYHYRFLWNLAGTCNFLYLSMYVNLVFVLFFIIGIISIYLDMKTEFKILRAQYEISSCE